MSIKSVASDELIARMKTACLLSLVEYHNQEAADILAVINRLEKVETENKRLKDDLIYNELEQVRLAKRRKK